MDNEFFLSEWRDFKTFERDEHGKILSKLKDVEEEVKQLNRWRWQMTGINMAVSFVVATFGAALMTYFLK